MNGELPDTNVLLALAWPNHQFHATARHWFDTQTSLWCTCPLTQLGFVRLSSNPAFTRHARTPLEAILLLREMVQHSRHRFLPDSEPVTSDGMEQVAGRTQGHQQVTDAYLLTLAREHGLTLATFDRRLVVVSPFEKTVRLLEA